METITSSLSATPVAAAQSAETGRSLRNLYFIRAGFSVAWVIFMTLFAKKDAGFASILLIIYPVWDVVGTFLDIRANSNNATSKKPQYINAVISSITTIAVVIALQKGVPEALMVFGTWAVGTGLIQLILGIRRKKYLSGQWPMIISGGQSVIGGTVTFIMAHSPTRGIPSLATYVAFGAFYYLLAAFTLLTRKKQAL